MKTAGIIRSIGAGVTLALLITGCAKSETASLPTPKNAIDFSPLVTRSVVTSLGEGDSFAVWARKSGDGTSQLILDQEEVQKFELDAKVKLDFHFANGQTSSATVVNIIPDEQHKNAVVVFECKDINEQLLGVRKQSVDITFTTYSGLRISASALYHEQNIPGVYVLDKTTIRFKPVEILKDQGSFILCEPKQGTDEEHTLNRLDLVIVESGGVSMRDGTTLDEDMVKGVESSNAGS